MLVDMLFTDVYRGGLMCVGFGKLREGFLMLALDVRDVWFDALCGNVGCLLENQIYFASSRRVASGKRAPARVRFSSPGSGNSVEKFHRLYFCVDKYLHGVFGGNGSVVGAPAEDRGLEARER
jgi:hypothetical protein